MTPRQAQEALQIGPTKLWELIKGGELDSFLDGNRRRVTTASIRDDVARRLARSPAKKAVPTRFRKMPERPALRSTTEADRQSDVQRFIAQRPTLRSAADPL
jgi:hypothetical protein